MSSDRLFLGNPTPSQQPHTNYQQQQHHHQQPPHPPHPPHPPRPYASPNPSQHLAYPAGPPYQQHARPTSPLGLYNKPMSAAPPYVSPTPLPMPTTASPYGAASPPAPVHNSSYKPNPVYNPHPHPTATPSPPPPHYASQFPKVMDNERKKKKEEILRRYREMRVEVCERLEIQPPITMFSQDARGFGVTTEIFESVTSMLSYHALVHEQQIVNINELEKVFRKINYQYFQYNVWIYPGEPAKIVEEFPTYDSMIDDLYDSLDEVVDNVSRICSSMYSNANSRRI